MNRRELLLALGAAPLLMLPRRTFFLPPAGGWMRWSNDEISNGLYSCKTPAEILADINRLMIEFWKGSYAIRPTHLILDGVRYKLEEPA